MTLLHDSFGNQIDPVVGFARGSILASPTEEGIRLREAQRVAAARVQRIGPSSISIFTGNKRDFLITPEDIHTLCEEWVGPGIFAQDLKDTVLSHLGGSSTHDVATFNRTSAAIIATIVALSGNRPVVSVVPRGGASHASVTRGAKLAAAPVVHVQIDNDWEAQLAQAQPELVIVTTVTSSLERLADADIRAVVAAAHHQGAVVLLDEAYGARLRTALHDGSPSLQLGADLTVTNSDKAGLSGPRAGVFAGVPALVAQVAAVAAGFGMEARAPISAGVLRSLQAYSVEVLRQESAEGAALVAAVAPLFAEEAVRATDLGPMINEEDVLRDALQRAQLKQTTIVPCEASAALGMILLRDHGILTVNTHGQPGARVSLRLKPTPGAVTAAGGVSRVAAAIEAGLGQLAELITQPDEIRTLILGGGS